MEEKKHRIIIIVIIIVIIIIIIIVIIIIITIIGIRMIANLTQLKQALWKRTVASRGSLPSLSSHAEREASASAKHKWVGEKQIWQGMKIRNTTSKILTPSNAALPS